MIFGERSEREPGGANKSPRPSPAATSGRRSVLHSQDENPRVVYMGIYKAAKSDNRIDALIELRNLIAKRLDQGVSDRDLAALSRQLVQVTAEIDEIRKAGEDKAASLTKFRNKLKVVS